MHKVYVAGVGMTPFGKYKEIDVVQFGINSSIEAIKDSDVDKRDIQIMYCGSARTGQMHGRECGVGQSILWRLGMQGIAATSIGNFCSSGSSAFFEAWLAIKSGLYDVAMAVGVEKMSVRAEKGKPLTSDGLGVLTSLGFTPPAHYAQVANRYSHEYGATPRDYALVAVKNRGNAVYNPYAQIRKPVTVEEVLESKMIVAPMTLFSCCPTGDGGATAILCSEDYRKKHGLNHAVEVAGMGQTSGVGQRKLNILEFVAESQAAKDAYQMAELGPQDIDVAEVHDAFTPAELLHYEAMGFCPPGDGVKLIRDGTTKINAGGVSVNPSGGLLSKGHPLGATGLGQITELVWQLRGTAKGRQVENAKVGLSHCSGGFPESPELGEGQATTIVILKK